MAILALRCNTCPPDTADPGAQQAFYNQRGTYSYTRVVYPGVTETPRRGSPATTPTPPRNKPSGGTTPGGGYQ